MRGPSALTLSIGFLTSCGQPPTPSTNPDPTTVTANQGSVVTGAELTRAGQNESLMGALKKIRPLFLSARGGERTILVSIDGSMVGNVSVLEVIPVSDVCEVRLQRGTSTAGQSGILPNGWVSSGGDVIDVSLRRDFTARCLRR